MKFFVFTKLKIWKEKCNLFISLLVQFFFSIFPFTIPIKDIWNLGWIFKNILIWDKTRHKAKRIIEVLKTWSLKLSFNSNEIIVIPKHGNKTLIFLYFVWGSMKVGCWHIYSFPCIQPWRNVIFMSNWSRSKSLAIVILDIVHIQFEKSIHELHNHQSFW